MTRDPYRYFRVEAREILDQLGHAALELDKGAATPELIASMFRLAHTLKGAARVVKQREIADHAHAIEDALTPFRETGGVVSRDSVEATLKALDGIAQRMVTLAEQGPGAGRAAVSPVTGKDAQAVHAAPLETVSSNVDEMDLLFEGLSEASAQLGGLRRGTDVLHQSQRLAQLLDEQRSASREPSDLGARLQPRMPELRGLIERAQRIFSDGVGQLNRELDQVREAAERLRLLPARLMFVPLERAARDAGESLGKRTAFTTKGGDVRVDAQVFGVVQSALVQAVRNAVAHGIETPAKRETVGKPAEGSVRIEVRQRGHQVVFVCRDDGSGVDLEAVRRAVERRGLAAADAAKLGAEELLETLLGGGISTSGAVTQLAGRGIGLDVIREAAHRLRGTVSIRTEEGLGTTLEIVVPVTLAAVDALIVECAGRTVGIPMSSVKRTLRVAKDDVADSSQGATVLFEGQAIPFAPLGRALTHAPMMRDAARAWSAVVIEGANALAVVGVERLCGTQSVVLRPLPALTPCDAIVAGASLDAEGYPQLVLDSEALVEHVRRAGPALAAAPAARAPILVIDDSLTTRMLEQSILESAGYEVDLATSAEDGLERARKRRYALFLVDVEMPGMDGFGFIEQVRADPILRDIPAVLVTSRCSPEDLARGRAVGAQAYIVKGEFDQTELLGRIRTLVGGR